VCALAHIGAQTRLQQSTLRSGEVMAEQSPQHTNPTRQAFQHFEHTLDTRGVRAALAYIVSQSDYRFISVFQFRDDKAMAALHFDREHPEQLRSPEVPDTATYCCYVRDSRGVFTTANAMLDARLADHVSRANVLAYCGVPVMDAEGQLLGTLCHYDVVPRNPEQLDLALLIEVASALARGGHVPPYPGDDAINDAAND
jgi:GAF domain-containing protein